MGEIIRRLLALELPPGKSAFLWGPRKVGKTYWIRHHLAGKSYKICSSDSRTCGVEGEAPAALPLEGATRAPVIDLLETDTFAGYAARPALLRERYQDHKGLIVIDEVQKVPALLDEVHWLIANRNLSFLLTGSSARKLRRGHANLLGGRAWRRVMCPLSIQEVEGFDLEAVMVSGLLPPHFCSPNPTEDLRAYVADYLKEEIAAEALTQNLPAFAEFLRVAALTNSELLNYTNIGREAGISAKIVRTYIDILEDTHLAFRVPPWGKAKQRRLVETEKLYLFDVGVANYLARRTPRIGSPEFGKAFEHYLLMELRAYQAYRNPELPLHFWRTAGGQEVDFILGDMEVVLEIKGSARTHEGDVRGLVAIGEEWKIKRRLLVSMEKQSRKITGGIQILPWRTFLDALWGDTIV